MKDVQAVSTVLGVEAIPSTTVYRQTPIIQESRSVARKPRDAATVCTFRFKVRRRHSLQV